MRRSHAFTKLAWDEATQGSSMAFGENHEADGAAYCHHSNAAFKDMAASGRRLAGGSNIH